MKARIQLAGGAELSLVKLTPAHLVALRSLVGEGGAGSARARLFVVGGEALSAQTAGFWLRRVQGPPGY